MIIDIGPKFYTGPSTNNNNDSFYKQIDQFSYIFRQIIDIGHLYNGPYLQPNGAVFKVSLFLKQLIYLNYIYNFWYDDRYWSKSLFRTIAARHDVLFVKVMLLKCFLNFTLKVLLSLISKSLMNFNYIRYDDKYWSQNVFRTTFKQL